MTTNIERAADVIADATIPPGTSIAWGMDRAVLAANLLADDGLLMPDLPTDDTVGMGSGEWSAGFGYEDEEENTYQAHAYAWDPGKIGISAPPIMDTDDAEAVALAILAAVRSDRDHHAEQEQGNDASH